VSTLPAGTKRHWEPIMALSSPEPSTGWREPPVPHDWEERVAFEAQRQARIERAFDRADAFARIAHYALAIEWLDLAGTLSGGLPPTYRARRARFVREMETGHR
jgi:hypothetical protein